MRAIGRIGFAALLVLPFLGGPVAADGGVNTGLFGGVAIKGYDTVAYFTEGRAMKGSEDFSHDWLGTPWHFANAEHRDLFASDPKKYAPQYGGYCVLGVGLGGFASENVDPEEAWRIIDGKLYLVSDANFAEYLDKPVREKVIAKADERWPEVKAKVERERFE